ncbi:MAG TPA: phage integrase SAM-like domain-containing protein, partial [Pyrinomonadaceae bacterium]|nr:phage integrase SAM-like domain-containing protein [Pyrinomonadaceae bacterium]
MAKKTSREENYGKYIFRRKRGDRTQIFARVGYYDENGIWKYKYELATDEDDAKIKAAKIIQTYKKKGTAYIDGTNMTFEELADWYKEKYAVPPTYENGQKSGGMRTWENCRYQLANLKNYFAKKRISKIDEEMLQQFKNRRKNIDKIKAASINRDLELLRAMFNKAVAKNWLEENPFSRSENLIRKSLETRRNNTTSLNEERLVLDFTKRSENKYLYPLILALRDTGARPSELYPFNAFGQDLDELAKKIKYWLEVEVKSESKEEIYLPLCWFQLFKVQFQVVPLISLKSDQVEYRFATMTTRLKDAFLDLWETTDKNVVSLVFPFKTIKKEWQKVRDHLALHQTFSQLQTIDDENKDKFLREAFGKKSAELLPFVSEDIETLINKTKELKIDLILENIKIADLRMRDWRRIYASNAQAAGMENTLTQRLMGHKLLQTTYHYTEADLQIAVDAARRMDEINLENE